MAAEFTPTRVYIAADHAGYAAKQAIVSALEGELMMQDLSAPELKPGDDFVPYAESVSQAVVLEPGSVGVLVCGSGEGMAIAANKIDGIRASVVWDEAVARETRQDNDANVVALPARFEDTDSLIAITRTFCTTAFSGSERHARRIEEITELEGK
jgi:ribose 5-phosphate isomerase B